MAPQNSLQAISKKRPFDVDIVVDEGQQWSKRELPAVTVWLKSFGHAGDSSALGNRLSEHVEAGEPENFVPCLSELEGQFAMIARWPGGAFAAVDRIRSTPVFFARAGDSFVLSPSAYRLTSRLGCGAAEVDPEAALSIAMAGYTIGTDTLYRNLEQLAPGECLLFGNDTAEPRRQRYAEFQPWRVESRPVARQLSNITEITRTMLENLVSSANGRTIAVPLSAGMDSRLVAAGLCEVGYRYVKCFAYGLPGNFEANASQRVAEALGYPWTFVPVSMAERRELFASSFYQDYINQADSCASVPVHQELTVLRKLLANGYIDRDTIVVNGQSGDYLTGDHIPEALQRLPADLDAETREQHVLDSLIDKHFSLWRALKTPDNLARVRNRLSKSIRDIEAPLDDPAGLHGVYEASEFHDRQTKYVITCTRVYEFFGLDWRLPLWDRGYLDFWERVPLENKINRSLFMEMLKRENWGGVWSDLPAPRYVRPLWVANLRRLLKIVFAPVGRSAWHEFERQYLEYWMQNTCSYALVPYRTVTRDKRGFRSGLSWHAERYLNQKGLSFDGQLLNHR